MCLYFYPLFCLSDCRTVPLSLFLLICVILSVRRSICLSFTLSACLSSVTVAVYLSVCHSVCHYMCLSVCLFACLKLLAYIRVLLCLFKERLLFESLPFGSNTDHVFCHQHNLEQAADTCAERIKKMQLT